MTASGRWLPALALLLAAVTPAASARAHGAEGLAHQGVSGPYLVSVFDGRAVEEEDRAEYRLVLTEDPKDGQLGAAAPVVPVPRAVVTVTDADGRTHRAEGIGNVYFFTLADRTQPLRLTISGPPGSTSLDVTVHGLEQVDSATSTRVVLLLTGALLLGLLVAILHLRRRGRRAGAHTAATAA